jgi:hypothetical protein
MDQYVRRALETSSFYEGDDADGVAVVLRTGNVLTNPTNADLVRCGVRLTGRL